MRELILALFLGTTLAVISVAAAAGTHRYHPALLTKNTEAVNPDEKTAQFWYDEAKDAINKRLNRVENKNIARNIIMFLGDGMSIPTLAAARALMGQRANKTGEETQMFFESFPTVGLSKTYCVDHQIADSACTATAYLCGVKNNYGTLGVTAEVPAYDCPASTDPSRQLDSIAAWAIESGRDAGIVTTTRVTHASPAGAYARSASRYWENDMEIVEDGQDPLQCRDIAHQLVHTSPGNQFKVILGGGRRNFLPNDTRDEEGTLGRRFDGRNIIQEWQDEKASRNLDYKYVWNRTELLALMDSPPEYLLGLFEGSHLQYHMQADQLTEPTLAELTEIAIRSLNRNEKGFFLFVESGRIDHAHHDNLVELSLDETLQMDLAIAKAVELLGSEDTLIVVTADHAHVMTYNGYTSRGSNILGASDKRGDDNIPYMTLSYSNGPGARTPINNSRVDVTQDSNFRDLEWPTHAEVILDSETHGGDDVAVFAVGPFNHLFTGVYEQTQIPFLMAYAACIGDGPHACSGSRLNHPLSLITYILAAVILLLFQQR